MISYQNILEACNNPHKRGNKRGTDGSKTPGSPDPDTSNTSSENLKLDDHHDVNPCIDSTNTSCCGVISNGKQHKSSECSSPKDQKTAEESFNKGKQNSHNKRIMVQPVVLPCNHGYCQECITHLTDMVSSLQYIYTYQPLNPSP